MPAVNYWKIMTRKKLMPVQEYEDTKFKRVFGTFDLTALGVSATLGVGVYVLAGHVAKIEAGPSVILSFFIAAAASFLAGLCYAEFASRVPKSGSAYVFTYVAIGEFVAFIIGWNLLLEYIIGSASIAKGLSLYIDSLINDTMKNTFKEITPITSTGNFLSSYFDFFAFSCPLLLGFALAFGLRKSAGMNNILCILNLSVVLFVVIVVLIYANIDYWQIDPLTVGEEYKEAVGNGGFFPFGFSGTVKGAATCFFGFVGYDCIATTGEEVRNPRKSVPRAILYSLVIIFLAYFGVSLLTLMWPYYLLNAEAPLPYVFNEKGLTIPKWIVTIGGIIGLIASLFGAMFPLPRILYAMSTDGLIFKTFGVISTKFQTPVIGTLCAAALTSCFAGLFDLAALVNMLSIGVLLAYTVVAISIIILRFSVPDQIPVGNPERYIETSNLLRPGCNITAKGFFMQLIRMNSSHQPNSISAAVVGIMILCFCLVSLMTALIITYEYEAIANGETWALVLLIVLVTMLLLFTLFISIQPRQVFVSRDKPFKVPMVPFLPAISIFINIYLMLMLDYFTWIRFGIWMLIGFMLYFPFAWYHHNCMRTNIKENEVHNEKTDQITFKESNDALEIIDEIQQKDVFTSQIDNSLSNQSSEANESLAIEMLDNILENEEYDSDKESYQTINIGKTPSIESQIVVSEVVINSIDVMQQIDEILEHAKKLVLEKELPTHSVKEQNENIFQNENFLTHLSGIILSNRNAIESQTLHRKNGKNTKKTGIKRTESAPNLQEMKSSLVEHKKKIGKNFQSIHNTELLEKFAEMKKKKKMENFSAESESSEEEPIDKDQFREKLEMLLSNPPTRFSHGRPASFTKFISYNNNNRQPKSKIFLEKPTPVRKIKDIQLTQTTIFNATLQGQKLIFDEVLKNIRKEVS